MGGIHNVGNSLTVIRLKSTEVMPAVILRKTFSIRKHQIDQGKVCREKLPVKGASTYQRLFIGFVFLQLLKRFVIALDYRLWYRVF